MVGTTMIAAGGMLALCPALAARKTAEVSPRATLQSGVPNLTSRLQCGVSSRTAAGQLLPVGFPQEARRRLMVIVKASETQVNVSASASDLLKNLQEQWAKLDDKLAISALGLSGLILLWASAGLLSALDKLPLIPNFFEIVGLLYTGWFIYRYLLFKPDREELLKLVDETKGKITGQ